MAPKHRFSQKPHGIISQKKAYFTSGSVRGLRCLNLPSVCLERLKFGIQKMGASGGVPDGRYEMRQHQRKRNHFTTADFCDKSRNTT
jgi:hypothetical protein